MLLVKVLVLEGSVVFSTHHTQTYCTSIVSLFSPAMFNYEVAYCLGYAIRALFLLNFIFPDLVSALTYLGFRSIL